jgi:hypothetical protein
MSRLVTGMRRRHQLTTSGEVQAAMCIAAARGLDQALAADNAYGIRQSIVSLRELVTDLHTPAADRADPIDALIANLASGPIRD